MMKGDKNPTVVVIGGGTGSFTLLSGLKNYTRNLTAIVNMADDGSSTGILRDELGVLPPGDARRCLVALSRSPKIRELFEYRFDGGALAGHAFGNLFLAALEKLTGSFAEAIETASEVLNVQGRVVPATLDNVRLRLSWPDKQIILNGERVIDSEHFANDPREATLSLVPDARANPAALAAIAAADIVVLAPGDLYTSLGPILVARGFRKALRTTRAQVVYACNLVTKQGQTEGFDVATHVAEIERFAGAPIVDTVLYNTGKPPAKLLERYAKKGEHWVAANESVLRAAHYRVVGGDFMSRAAAEVAVNDALVSGRTFIRHDTDKVARALLGYTETQN
jgi:uncharacterized cofD-like protein